MKFVREPGLPYPQPWEWIKDNIEFNDVECFYVDIGANDGIISSNTAYFDLNLNWRGLCIEPHPRAFQCLQKNRPNSVNLNICISDNEEMVDFLVINGYSEMLSGIKNNYHPDHLKRINFEIQEYGGNTEINKIQSKPLLKIFKEFDVSKVDYLSVDTEGSEYEILSGINFDEVDIRVISTENSSKKNIRQFLEDKNYIFLGQVCCDEIYCKK